MHRSSAPVQVATSAPLLRAVLILLLIVAAVAGVLGVAGWQIGWVALGVSLVAGPVAVIVEGRRRAAARDAATPEISPIPPSRAEVAARQPEAPCHLGRPCPVVQDSPTAW